MYNGLRNSLDEVISKAPPFPEVNELINFFEEISEPYVVISNDMLWSKLKGSNCEVRLEIIPSRGARVEYGVWDKFYEYFCEIAEIYAGLSDTGTWVYGLGSEQKHSIRIEIDKLDLNDKDHRQIFESLGKFYERIKNMKLGEEKTFDGVSIEEPPL